MKSAAASADFLVTGDFNFFPQLGGPKQRAILTSAGCQDLGKGARTLGGKEIEGTFVGYEHDEFKADLKNINSRLDHIFSSGGFSGSSPTLYTRTMLEHEPEELTTRDYPSDHLPLVINIEQH